MHELLIFAHRSWGGPTVVLTLLAVVLVAACGATGSTRADATPAPPTGAAAFAATQQSGNGLFRVSYEPDVQPAPLNAVHAWTLHVARADGRPVEGAQITVSGGMPQHRHGMPTQPEVSAGLGGGAYRVEGMKFQMPGWWAVTFEIEAQGEKDTVTFNLMLQ